MTRQWGKRIKKIVSWLCSQHTLNSIPQGDVVLYKQLFSLQESDRCYAQLMHETPWQSHKIKLFGKAIDQPRLIAFYGESDKPYTYSGITLHPMPWTLTLQLIKASIETVAQVKFTSVLLNLYRNGHDHMSWHSDDEPALGRYPVLGSVSFGATRKFQLKHKTKKVLSAEVLLTHGSFLLMQGATQHYWHHRIPKTMQKISPRINLTFRIIKRGP